MKFLLLVCTLFFVASTFAQTDIYYDSTYRGEGVTVFETTNLKDEDIRTVYLYTYGAEVCDVVIENTTVTVEVEATATAECPNSIFPPFAPLCDPVVVTETVTETVPTQSVQSVCNLNGQRWFVGNDLILKNGDSVGIMYTATGVKFPECIPSEDPFEEDVEICGDVTEVGEYIIRPLEGGGYEMWIASDDKTDPAFNRRYRFDTSLLNLIEPK